MFFMGGLQESVGLAWISTDWAAWRWNLSNCLLGGERGERWYWRWERREGGDERESKRERERERKENGGGVLFTY